MGFIFLAGIFSEIDFKALLFGEESPLFLFEVLIRSIVMFIVILISLRIVGKRSISQLSVFELGVIIGLGSAAGDPMFYKDVGLVPSILAFVVIIAFYRFITFLVNYNAKAEKILEGVPVYIAEKGKLNISNFEKELLAHEEFFSQLRMKHVTHLGQVYYAILETNGNVSVIYYPDEDVKWGLPVLPHLCEAKSNKLSGNGIYACTFCGHIDEVKSNGNNIQCPVCEKDEWVPALNEVRIA